VGSPGSVTMFKRISAEDAERNRKDRDQRIQAKEASQKRMIAHLVEQVAEDSITNDWEREFIGSLNSRVNSAFFYLSDKQDAILTKLFEQY